MGLKTYRYVREATQFKLLSVKFKNFERYSDYIVNLERNTLLNIKKIGNKINLTFRMITNFRTVFYNLSYSIKIRLECEVNVLGKI